MSAKHPTLAEAQTLDARYVMHTYARKPVMFVRGDGMCLFDDTGRDYLDFVAGIGAVNLGHAHPAVTAAVAEQAGKLTHVSNLYFVEHRDELAQDIVTLAGGGRQVFFANSGTEAVEGAIKLARRWGKKHHGEGCVNIVTAERSFHGRTLAALAATGQPSKQEAFAPLPGGFCHVPLNDIAALEAAVTADTCAVMLEPIQGEGGVYPCDTDYLLAARALCDERGILLVLDEVQTGCYRTGSAFAFQAYGVEPDIFTLAKSLANGLPIGAVVATTEVAEAFEPGDHGSTFGGSPLVCAAGRATLHALAAERLGERALQTGAYLHKELHELMAATGAINDVRRAGLMAGVELHEPRAAEACAFALQHGIVLNNIGPHILRILPPLVCGNAEIDTLVGALYEFLATDNVRSA